MDKVIESLRKEIKAVMMGKMPEKSQSYANGYISGLYFAIDVIKSPIEVDGELKLPESNGF